MLKTIRDMLLGAIVCASIGAAMAVVGTPPTPATGPGLVDGTWLNGLASGQNYSYQYAFTAVGTTQATALQLPAGIALLEVDTAGSGGATGVALPPCFQGAQITLNDNTAYTIDVYPAIANNSITAAQDTINNTTSTTITTYAAKTFSCAKNGVWSAK
jgi:hypothetical protein